jgi:hypothetical protein
MPAEVTAGHDQQEARCPRSPKSVESRSIRLNDQETVPVDVAKEELRRDGIADADLRRNQP